MDDPWGSPWASSENVPRSLLSPPPKAFFGGGGGAAGAGSAASSPGLAPWTDNAALGGWPTPDYGDNNIWAVGAADSPARTPHLVPKPDAQTASIAFPENTAASPAFPPSLRSRTSSVFRQSSPDPWASDSPWLDSSLSLPQPELHSRHDDGDDNAADTRSRDRVGNTPDDVVIRVEEPPVTPRTPAPPSAASGKEDAQPAAQQDGSRQAAASEHPDVPSKPPSTLSADSDRGPDRPDSPITSVDEDHTLRPQHSLRRASGKVAQLVDKFDGIARALSDESTERQRQPSTISETQERSHGELRAPGSCTPDVSDAENPGAGALGTSETSSPTRPLSPEPGSAPAADLHDRHCEGPHTERSTHHAAAPKAPSKPVQELIEKFGPIPFPVDVDRLDDLPDLVVEPSANEDKHMASEVSDRIISDSFETVEERKAWYRISRYGSMRKHNSGDDENYHGVVWSSSQLHGETIKVVRRWMEEDSFSGRPTFGGSKRMGVFNWDSKAAPVDMDKIFGPRPSAAPSRSSSIALQSHTPRSSTDSGLNSFEQQRVFSSPPAETSSPTSSPAASFGWNSPAPSSPPAKPPYMAFRFPAPPKAPTPLSLPPLVPSAPQADKAVSPVPLAESGEGAFEDDDDDWGEMVSSPTHVLDSGFPELSAPLTELTNTVSGPMGHRNSNSLAGKPAGSDRSPLVSDREQAPQAVPNARPASAAASKAPMVDAWASADFSLFETSLPAADARPPPADTSETVFTKPPVAQRVNTSPSRAVPATPTNVVLGPVIAPKVEEEQERLVRSIIQNLPDLSYMVR